MVNPLGTVSWEGTAGSDVAGVEVDKTDPLHDCGMTIGGALSASAVSVITSAFTSAPLVASAIDASGPVAPLLPHATSAETALKPSTRVDRVTWTSSQL